MQVVSYNAPFFTTWFCTNWTVLFFPLYFICYLISTKCKSPGNILRESVRNFRDKGFTAGKLKKKSSGEIYTVFTGTNILSQLQCY
jgi:solute carrier family 35 protein F3/4